MYNKSLALPFYTSILTNIYLIFNSEERKIFDCMQGRRHAVRENVYRETYTNGSYTRYTETLLSHLFLTVYAFSFNTEKV